MVIHEGTIYNDQFKPEYKDVRRSHSTITVFWEASDFLWETYELLRGHLFGKVDVYHILRTKSALIHYSERIKTIAAYI